MKGYYVIPYNEDPIEFTGKGSKQQAIKKGKELFFKGDFEIAIMHFDDDNTDGFFAGEDMIMIKDIIKKELENGN